MIVGTAGHIDHGKTTLVRALTGVDTDRLKEEKARGISIELGYAYTPLSNGAMLGFVDVPGHERLVHTMAAGACGIDFALLVVAADDGIMPQTREHVAILQLFGISRGAVAVTKVDRVDAGRLARVAAEVRGLLAGTALQDAPMFRVNAVLEGDVGTGLLKEYLERVACGPGPLSSAGLARGGASVSDAGYVRAGPSAGAAPSARAAPSAGAAPYVSATPPAAATSSVSAARDTHLFRLAVDRVFTLAGRGTVVAGTVFSGTVRVGETVVVFPSNIPARVRSIHAHNRPSEVGHSGERCALTLAGVETSDVKRGDWLADSRVFVPTSRIDVRLELLARTIDTGAPSGRTAVIKPGLPVHFHHGAAHLTAHLIPLIPCDSPTALDSPTTPDSSTARRGTSCYAQIVFDTPTCAIAGDRFVIRDAQAMHTLGGGVVLDPYAPSRKRRSPERMRYLSALERLISGDGLRPLLQEAPYGIKQSELIRLCNHSTIDLPDDVLTVEGVREQYVLLSSAWRALRDGAVRALQQFHLDTPDEPGPDIGRLRRIAFPQLADDAWRTVISELISERAILRSGPWVYLPGHAVTLSDAESSLATKLQPLIAAGRFNPPWVRDLAHSLNEPEERVRQVLRKQVTQGTVYQVVHDLFYDRHCVNELATTVTKLAHEHGTIEAAQYRDALGLGRKRAIQILEFFDRVGHTRRIRDSRVVRSDSAWLAA